MHRKKTQKIVIIILIVAAILGLIGVGIAYYISTTAEDDMLPPGFERYGQYCSYIVAYTTPQCNSCDCPTIEDQTLDSRIGKVVNGECIVNKSDLDIGSLRYIEPDIDAEEFLDMFEINDEFPEDEQIEPEIGLINCVVPSVRYSSCHSVTVKEPNTQDLIIPPIDINNPILIGALFVPEKNEEFERFHFTINGEIYDVEREHIKDTTIDDENAYLAELAFSKFEQANTLTISANAFSNINPEGISQSKYCYKQYVLSRAVASSCTSVEATVRRNANQIDQLRLRISNLKLDSNIKLEFSFDKEYETFTMQNIPDDLLEVFLVNNTITIEQEFLYPSRAHRDLYDNNQGFPIFGEDGGEHIRLNVQVYENDQLIDSSLCYTYLNITVAGEEEIDPDPEPEPEPEEPDEEPDEEEPDQEPDEEEPDEEDPDTELPDTGIIQFTGYAIGFASILLGILIYQGRLELVNRLSLVVTKKASDFNENFEEKTIKSVEQQQESKKK